ncbi:MAG: hypothetical protein K2J01_06725 [Clostridiales bacterium]|nr:hypothetical protein [Clostridiales bacterium]
MSKNNNRNNPLNRVRSSREKYKIRKWYADKAKKEKAEQVPVANNHINVQTEQSAQENSQNKFPSKFPFWARFKPNKGRTTLVIDEEQVNRNNSEKVDDCFVHREAIHCTEDNKYVKNGDYEKIFPNPDRSDPEPMYLKRPHKHPKRMFAPHNKSLTMPEHLRLRYDKNNQKNKADSDDGDK